jgi:hypothetical protein
MEGRLEMEPSTNVVAGRLAKLSQLSIGFAQAYREVVFWVRKWYGAIQNSQSNCGSGFGSSRNSWASANVKYAEGVMVFTMQKGGLYEASVVDNSKFTKL